MAFGWGACSMFGVCLFTVVDGDAGDSDCVCVYETRLNEYRH